MTPPGRGHATPIATDTAGDFNAAAALVQEIPPGLSPGETAALLASRGLKVFRATWIAKSRPRLAASRMPQLTFG